MKKYHILFLLFFVFIFSSCFKEDDRYIPVPLIKFDIPYSMYEYQTYYSITDSAIVFYNHYEDWDLGFESTEDGYHIILNYARFMYAGNTFETDFNSVTSNSADEMLFDNSSGDLDSTVFNDWADFSDPENPVFNKYVYIIDRGKNELGDDFGLKKIVIEKLENDTFFVYFSNLDNSDEHFYEIPKDTAVNFTLFSLDDGGSMAVQEPDKSVWDICFTKYSTIIPDDFGVPTDYLVRGVFINPYKNIEVATDTVHYFYDITSDMMPEYYYSSKRDAIGYNWKTFIDGKYEIEEDDSYILRNVSGRNYKMRFVKFYNDLGEKGYPSFEITELQNF